MWEIYAYHNSEALAGIFNAVAAIMASGTFKSAVGAVAFVGFCAAMVIYGLQPERAHGWKWLAGVVLIYGVLFVPRVSVGVVDKTGGTPARIIANVPFGMAFLGGLTSTIGNTVTELFETAFQVLPGSSQLPAELAYQRNGLMFGSRLIQETRRLSLPDPAALTDVMNFVNNCTLYDIADGTINAAHFAESDDLWSLMATTNPARFTVISMGSGVTNMTCDAAYTNLSNRLPAQVDKLSTMLGRRLNPTLPSAAARVAVLNQIPQAYIRSEIASAAATAADIIRQNALINAINDAGDMSCQRSNDPACMMLATGRAQAVAAQNAAWINGAKVAEQALPVVRNVAEAVIYAVFPLVVLLLLVSAGRTTLMIISGYAIALVSIQLWPPLFAILNYMATLVAQTDQAAAAELGSGVKALSLQTASPIYANAVSAQAVVSYLIIGIPMLAYALANRMMHFGSAAMGGLQGLSSSSVAGNPAAAAASGNASVGNVTMDQRNVSPMTSNPWVDREQNDWGTWQTRDNHGRTAISLLRNEGITGQVVTARVSQDDVQAAGKATSAAAAEVVAAGTSQTATLRQGLDRVRQRVDSARSTAGQSLAGYEEVSRSYDRMWGEVTRISKETGVAASEVAQTMLRFSMMPGAFGVGGGAQVGKNYDVNVSETEKKVLDHTNQDTYKAAKAFGDRLTHDQGFLNTLSSEGRSGETLASELASAGQRSESAERRYNEAVTYSEQVSRAYQLGLGYSRDLAADPANSALIGEYERAARRYRGSPQALAAHMAGWLGNFAPRPTRIVEGAALPAGFGDVRGTHDQQRLDPAVNPDVAARKAGNDAVVRDRPVDEPGAAPRPSSPGTAAMPPAPGTLPGGSDGARVRSDVAAAGEPLRDGNAGRADNFEKDRRLKRDADGNLITDYSLVRKSVSMHGRDTFTGIELLGELARDIATSKQPDGTSKRARAGDHGDPGGTENAA